MNKSTIQVVTLMSVMNSIGPYGSTILNLFPESPPKPRSKCTSCRFDVKGNEAYCRGKRKELYPGCAITVKECEGYSEVENG